MNKCATEQEEVFASPLLAKAMFSNKGKVNIIAVFEKSTLYKFFYLFEADTFKSPTKAWRWTGQYYNVMAKGDDLHTLENFAMSYVQRLSILALIEYKYYCTKNYYAEFTERIGHPFKNIHRVIPVGATFDLVNKRNRYARGETKGFYFNRRQEFETVKPPHNEVWIYLDLCDECGERHAFAHYPDGKTVCKEGVLQADANPNLIYVHHEKGRYRYQLNFPA